MEDKFEPITHTINDIKLGTLKPLEESLSLISNSTNLKPEPENEIIKKIEDVDIDSLTSLASYGDLSDPGPDELSKPSKSRTDYNEIEIPRKK